jgi:hypothetical protein
MTRFDNSVLLWFGLPRSLPSARAESAFRVVGRPVSPRVGGDSDGLDGDRDTVEFRFNV